jgi:hypothetical protein
VVAGKTLRNLWVRTNSSYFSVSAEPWTEHPQLDFALPSFSGISVEFTHFTAEAEKADCFRARYIAGFLFIDAVDSDEARYRMDRHPHSISQPKN